MALDRWLRIARLRLRSLTQHSRVEDELDEEMRFHLEERIRQLTADGMRAEDARDAALRAFGGLEQRKEECRDTRRIGLVEDFVKDIAYALRVMRRTPAFTGAAVLSLGIGIGATTAIFNVFDALILRPLPVDRPEQLRTTYVTVSAGSRGIKETDSIPYGFLRALQSDSSVFSEILATGRLDQSVVSDQARPLRTPGGGITVSANYFTMLGIRARLGRLFDPRDGSATDHSVVLSDRFWQREFSGDPAVLGRALEINGRTFIVIGVAPPSFFGLAIGRAPDFFITMVPSGPNLGFPVQPVGRLQAHVTDAMAAQWITTFWQATEFSKSNLPSPSFALRSAEPGLSPVRQRFMQPLSLLISMVGLLLLIACANVATMQLARASARKTEILIRSSIGAGKGRLLRQLTAESAVLVVLAATAGLLFASWGTQTLLRLMQSLDAPLTMPAGYDVRVILFAIGVSAVACVITGFAPALHTVRVDANGALRDRSDTRTAPVAGRLGRSFVVAQVALSLALVAAAALLARTLYGLTRVDAGFTPDGIAIVSVNPGARSYQGGALATYFNTLTERFNRFPGVERITLAQFSFLIDARTTGTIDVPGFTPASDEDRWVQVYQVGARFFETLHIPVVQGRDFDERDLTSTPIAIALNETAARRFFGTQPAVGRSIVGDAGKRQYRVIGIVRDGRYNTLRQDMEAVIFVPYTHTGRNRMTYLVKFADTDRATGQLQTLLDEARAVDPLVPIEADTLEAVVGRSVGQERLLAIIATFFALTALLLMSLGLYGVMAYSVAARTPEIGVRLALGARRSQVVWHVVQRPLVLIAIGLFLGVAATIGAGRYASHLLYGLAPQDPLTLAASITFLGLVALVAGAAPARRASRIDPAVALRCE